MEYRKISMPEIDHEQFIEAFNAGKFDVLDAMTEKVDNAWKEIFENVQRGKFNIAWWDCCHYGKSFLRYALHRSTKQSGYLQLSCMEIRDGKIIPTSDAQFNKAEDFLRDGRGKSDVIFVR